jgi:hypothetical protein
MKPTRVFIPTEPIATHSHHNRMKVIYLNALQQFGIGQQTTKQTNAEALRQAGKDGPGGNQWSGVRSIPTGGRGGGSKLNAVGVSDFVPATLSRAASSGLARLDLTYFGRVGTKPDQVESTGVAAALAEGNADRKGPIRVCGLMYYLWGVKH